MKPLYQSKIIGLAALGITEALSDGIVNNWTWRQFVIAGLSVATIVVRAFFTNTAVPEGTQKAGG